MSAITELQTARKAVAVTPDDDNDLPLTGCRALWVNDAGNVEVICAGDTVAVVLTVLDSQLLPLQVKRVLATNTTSSEIFALY